MPSVFNGERTLLSPGLGPVERVLFWLEGTSKREDQRWTLGYAAAMLSFNIADFLLLHAMQRFQGSFPSNPAAMGAVLLELSFSTAVTC